MSLSSLRFVVVLGPPSAASSLLAGVVCHCTSLKEADALFDSETPDLLVINSAVDWHVSVAGRRLRHLCADADAALLAAKRELSSRASPPRKEVQSNDHLNAA